jgi:hypothetical protein
MDEKEILFIVETLKITAQCRAIHVYPTFSAFQPQCVLRWLLFLEYYRPLSHYINGKKNLTVDARSRLPFSERQPSDHGS